MGPKLTNCCKPEQVGTQKIWQNDEENSNSGRRQSPKEAKNWRIEGQKRRITRKDYQRLVNKFEMEGFMAQKGLWNFAKGKILRERGELPKAEGDAVREYKKTS